MKRQLLAVSSPLPGGGESPRRRSMAGLPTATHGAQRARHTWWRWQCSGGRTVQLKSLIPVATNTMNITFIVLDKTARAVPLHDRGNARKETCLALMADEMAAVHFLLWGAECDAFKPRDIVRLTDGIFSYHRGNSLALCAGWCGRTEKVGEYTMLLVETPNISELKWTRDPGDPKRMVQEAVVLPHSQVFKPLQ